MAFFAFFIALVFAFVLVSFSTFVSAAFSVVVAFWSIDLLQIGHFAVKFGKVEGSVTLDVVGVLNDVTQTRLDGFGRSRPVVGALVSSTGSNSVENRNLVDG